MILYFIVSGNIGSVFNIDMYIGEFYIVFFLDREIMGKFRLNIFVNDCGFFGKIVYIVIYINVFDVNDNVFVFERDIYEVIILENIIRG